MTYEKLERDDIARIDLHIAKIKQDILTQVSPIFAKLDKNWEEQQKDIWSTPENLNILRSMYKSAGAR